MADVYNSYAVKKKVLQPDLLMAYGRPRDFLRVDIYVSPSYAQPVIMPQLDGTASSLPDAAPLTSMQQQFATGASTSVQSLSSDSDPIPGAPTAQNRSVSPMYRAMSTALLRAAYSSTTEGQVTVDNFLRACRATCMAHFRTHLAYAWGANGNPMSMRFVTYVVTELSKMQQELDKIIPFPDDDSALLPGNGCGAPPAANTVSTSLPTAVQVSSMTTLIPGASASTMFKTPVSLQTFMDKVGQYMMNYRNTVINETLRTWLFTEEVITLFGLSFSMYYRAKFVGTFQNGPWNLSGQLSNVSFYDARYGKLVMALMAISFYSVLKLTVATYTITGDWLASENFPGGPSQTDVNNRFSLDFKSVVQSETQKDTSAVYQAQSLVATMSNNTKKQATQLYRSDQALTFRKQALRSISTATSSDMKRLGGQVLNFYAWVAAYVVILGVSIALIATDRQNMFILMCIVIIGLVVLVTVGRLLMRVVQRAVLA